MEVHVAKVANGWLWPGPDGRQELERAAGVRSIAATQMINCPQAAADISGPKKRPPEGGHIRGYLVASLSHQESTSNSPLRALTFETLAL